MRVELIGHFKPCMNYIYLLSDARMADYIYISTRTRNYRDEKRILNRLTRPFISGDGLYIDDMNHGRPNKEISRDIFVRDLLSAIFCPRVFVCSVVSAIMFCMCLYAMLRLLFAVCFFAPPHFFSP